LREERAAYRRDKRPSLAEKICNHFTARTVIFFDASICPLHFTEGKTEAASFCLRVACRRLRK
jgi:hypothetical protein